MPTVYLDLKGILWSKQFKGGILWSKQLKVDVWSNCGVPRSKYLSYGSKVPLKERGVPWSNCGIPRSKFISY